MHVSFSLSWGFLIIIGSIFGNIQIIAHQQKILIYFFFQSKKSQKINTYACVKRQTTIVLSTFDNLTWQSYLSQGLGRICCQRDYGPLLDHIKGHIRE